MALLDPPLHRLFHFRRQRLPAPRGMVRAAREVDVAQARCELQERRERLRLDITVDHVDALEAWTASCQLGKRCRWQLDAMHGERAQRWCAATQQAQAVPKLTRGRHHAEVEVLQPGTGGTETRELVNADAALVEAIPDVEGGQRREGRREEAECVGWHQGSKLLGHREDKPRGPFCDGLHVAFAAASGRLRARGRTALAQVIVKTIRPIIRSAFCEQKTAHAGAIFKVLTT